MMNQYDEYQKHIRYKYDSYAFMLLLILVFANFTLTSFNDFQWAETPHIEPLIIILLVMVFFTVILVYSGAYFTIRESVLVLGIVFLLSGNKFFSHPSYLLS